MPPSLARPNLGLQGPPTGPPLLFLQKEASLPRRGLGLAKGVAGGRARRRSGAWRRSEGGRSDQWGLCVLSNEISYQYTNDRAPMGGLPSASSLNYCNERHKTTYHLPAKMK